ncbi:MAG: hypothetical protein WA213_16790 [Terriglobales bacterium]
MPTKAGIGVGRSSQPTYANSGTSGPSFLGLNQPFTEGNGNSSTDDTSHDESFSGLDSFFEQDEPGVSGRGIFLLLVLLAALGAGGWWAYTHYNGAAPAPAANAQTTAPTTAQPAPAPASGTETAANSASNAKPSEPSPSPSANSSPSQSTPNPSTPNPSASTSPISTSASSPQPAAVPPAETVNATPPSAVEPKSERSAQNSSAPMKPAARTHSSESSHAAREQKIARADIRPVARPSAAIPASSDKGEAEFKRGEAYLYGRGMPENCNEAIKNLKDASAKQNAKARSTFGTMYATGHCVPRDLPTSYSWFAQALRVDPNNQILEKDLTAVWNQMTTPERQMIARNKQ